MLEEVLQPPENKVLIFSEWERMLQLVRQLAVEMSLDFAWHTGSVPQRERRRQINRFKNDPGCRLFLSTDAGSTGLNLQAANVVINLDLPWNPAKFEQRIARAWRKHQTRSVSVVNLVCQDSIEHRMLALLAKKQQLADGVVDGRGDLKSMPLPSGRVALIERLEALMGIELQKAGPSVQKQSTTPPAVAADPYEVFRSDLVGRLSDRLLVLESRSHGNGRDTLFAVVDGQAEQVKPLAERLLRESFAANGGTPSLELVDRATYETIQRLIDAGLLKVSHLEPVRLIHRNSAFSLKDSNSNGQRRREAQLIFSEADRKMRLAKLLADGGFPAEALPPLSQALDTALKALACLQGEKITDTDGQVSLNLVHAHLVGRGTLPDEVVSLVARLRLSAGDSGTSDDKGWHDLMESARGVFDRIHITLNQASVG